MRRIAVIALLALPANAADLPDRACAPAVNGGPPICVHVPQEAVGASIPRELLIGRALEEDFAACRAVADKAGFPAWRDTLFERCLYKLQWRRSLTQK